MGFIYSAPYHYNIEVINPKVQDWVMNADHTLFILRSEYVMRTITTYTHDISINIDNIETFISEIEDIKAIGDGIRHVLSTGHKSFDIPFRSGLSQIRDTFRAVYMFSDIFIIGIYDTAVQDGRFEQITYEELLVVQKDISDYIDSLGYPDIIEA